MVCVGSGVDNSDRGREAFEAEKTDNQKAEDGEKIKEFLRFLLGFAGEFGWMKFVFLAFY
jgi:hypothetical protein